MSPTSTPAEAAALDGATPTTSKAVSRPHDAACAADNVTVDPSHQDGRAAPARVRAPAERRTRRSRPGSRRRSHESSSQS